MGHKQDYQHKMQVLLDEWRAEITDLKTKAERAEINLELEYYTTIEKLEIEAESLHQKLQLLKLAKGEQWEEIKTDFESSWNTMREVIKSITAP